MTLKEIEKESTIESLEAERRQLIDQYGEAAVIRIGDWGKRYAEAKEKTCTRCGGPLKPIVELGDNGEFITTWHCTK